MIDLPVLRRGLLVASGSSVNARITLTFGFNFVPNAKLNICVSAPIKSSERFHSMATVCKSALAT